MIKTLQYVVTYKEFSKDPQQQAPFNSGEAAADFAIAIEQLGGVAVITTRLKPEPIASGLKVASDFKPLTKYQRKD